VTSPLEEEDAFDARVTQMRAVLNEVHEDLVTAHLSTISQERDGQNVAERIYGRLEAMPARDLALAVVLALNDEADRKARRLWSELHTFQPRSF
jgi:hypothetical protein